MTISTRHISETLGAYLAKYPQDKAGLAGALALLDTDADLGSRAEMRGHATAGVVLLDDAGDVLHIRHLALKKVLLPGGHLEPEDDALLEAALRELTEETGIPRERVSPISSTPVHVDMHMIPANEAKGEGEHPHIDFRFPFVLIGERTDLRLQVEEVTGYDWLPATDAVVPDLPSRLTQLLI